MLNKLKNSRPWSTYCQKHLHTSSSFCCFPSRVRLPWWGGRRTGKIVESVKDNCQI